MNAWQEWPGGQDLPPQQTQDPGSAQWDLRGPRESHIKGRSGTAQTWPAENPFGLQAPAAAAALTERGSCPAEVAAMSDEQLYSFVLNMKQPSGPSMPMPAGAQARQPPYSVEDAKDAIKTAKASIGSKTSSKAEQGNESGSEEDEKSESFAGKSKRVLANRQSAHRSRLRKLQYIQDLENNVNKIQTEISQIQPQLTFLREKYSDLASQNHNLREKVTRLLNEARYKESINNTLRDEVKQIIGEGGNVSHSAEDQGNLFALPPTVNYAATMN